MNRVNLYKTCKILPKVQYRYISVFCCRGTETKKYRPRFTFMGFRYVELSGTEYEEGLLYHNYSCLYMQIHVHPQYIPFSHHAVDSPLELPDSCSAVPKPDCYKAALFSCLRSENSLCAPSHCESHVHKAALDIRYTQMDNKEGYVAPVVPSRGPEGVGFMSMLGWGNAVTILPRLLWL